MKKKTDMVTNSMKAVTAFALEYQVCSKIHPNTLRMGSLALLLPLYYFINRLWKLGVTATVLLLIFARSLIQEMDKSCTPKTKIGGWADILTDSLSLGLMVASFFRVLLGDGTNTCILWAVSSLAICLLSCSGGRDAHPQTIEKVTSAMALLIMWLTLVPCPES